MRRGFGNGDTVNLIGWDPIQDDLILINIEVYLSPALTNDS